MAKEFIALTNIEKEIVTLSVVSDSINEIINYNVFSIVGVKPDTNILFKSDVHQRLFFILLVDFLSRPRPDPLEIGMPIEYLNCTVFKNPSFDKNGSIEQLVASVRAFDEWLDHDVVFEHVWLQTLGREVDLSFSRRKLIKICGDISKHNFARLSRRVESIQLACNRQNVALDASDAIVALDDFYDKFHRDILLYHSSTIAELLNNIRWGIHEYLQPEFFASIVYEDAIKYR